MISVRCAAPSHGPVEEPVSRGGKSNTNAKTIPGRKPKFYREPGPERKVIHSCRARVSGGRQHRPQPGDLTEWVSFVFNFRFLADRAPYHEAHLPTFRRSSQENARLSRPHEDARWPLGHSRASRQRPSSSCGLTRSIASVIRARIAFLISASPARHRARQALAQEAIDAGVLAFVQFSAWGTHTWCRRLRCLPQAALYLSERRLRFSCQV